jgi:hypothetical protein
MAWLVEGLCFVLLIYLTDRIIICSAKTRYHSLYLRRNDVTIAQTHVDGSVESESLLECAMFCADDLNCLSLAFNHIGVGKCLISRSPAPEFSSNEGTDLYLVSLRYEKEKREYVRFGVHV